MSSSGYLSAIPNRMVRANSLILGQSLAFAPSRDLAADRAYV